MIKKRLISSIVCRSGNVVQSFGYDKFLPIGSIESSVKNLNRWNADEIIILSIDRSINNSGPDFDIIKKIKKLKIETPIIYGGGISNYSQAKKVIELGADRIVLESVVNQNFNHLKEISESVGSQSVILSMPLTFNKKNELLIYDYKLKKEKAIGENFIKAIKENLISEILISDFKNQGTMKGFNHEILKKFNFKKNLILHCGIYEKENFKKIFSDKRVVACVIGNNLNYGEHKIQEFKSKLSSKYFREAHYSSRI